MNYRTLVSPAVRTPLSTLVIGATLVVNGCAPQQAKQKKDADQPVAVEYYVRGEQALFSRSSLSVRSLLLSTV